MGEATSEFEAIVTAIDEVVAVFDSSFRLVRVNPVLRRLLGFEPLGMTIEEATKRLGVAYDHAVAVEILNGRLELNRDLVEVVSGGQPRTLSLSTRVLDDASGRRVLMVARDITPHVIQARQLSALAARLLTVREEERTRIARDLHDDLGQALTAVRLSLEGLQRSVKPNLEERESAELLGAVIENSEQVADAISRVQTLVADLRPPLLDRLGLPTALQAELRRPICRALRCELVVQEGFPETLPSPVATALYRVAQEAITNIARHAAASMVTLTLEATPTSVTLRVEDDGVGFEPSNAGQALGLLGMRERLAALGGTLAIERRQPRGVQVAATVQRVAP